ncbi:MAG: hypothetical protein ACFCVK_11935 [Acidimicrobiales bacterium]
MLITISSVGGAPGVTSWALLLAAAWPSGVGDHDRVVLEADCDGGVLGARYELGVEPGAVALISACRRREGQLVIEQLGRPLAEGLWVVPGPEVAEQARPVWTSGATDVADRLAADRRWWIVDGGRLRPGSPLAALAAAATVNLVVSGPSLAALIQLPARLASLGGWGGTDDRSGGAGDGPTVGVIVVGRPDHHHDELREYLDPAPIWVVPSHDDLPALALGAVRGGRARRSLVWRAALDLAADIALLAAPVAPVSPLGSAAGADGPAHPISPAMEAAMASVREHRR